MCLEGVKYYCPLNTVLWMKYTSKMYQTSDLSKAALQRQLLSLYTKFKWEAK